MLTNRDTPPHRVLMTVDAVGGVWQYAVGLAEELVRAGRTVVFAGLGPPPSDDQLRRAEKTATVRWLKTRPEWMAADETEMERFADELMPLVHEHSIDIIHLNAPSQAVGLAPDCPVVAISHSCVSTWFHAVRGESVPEGWTWQQQRNRSGFDRADISIAPSVSHASMLKQCYGNIRRLGVVHNSVTPATTSERRDDIIFAAARWWDEGKNAVTLDAAAAKTIWPVFVGGPIAGPNGEATVFENAISLGVLPHDHARRLMAKCGIFVSPSLYEPFGLATLEAASAGTPLVLADIPTYRELWEGAAEFFAPRDFDALAEALDRLAVDADERSRLGRFALRRSRRFTRARQSAAMLSVYENAASIFSGKV